MMEKYDQQQLLLAQPSNLDIKHRLDRFIIICVDESISLSSCETIYLCFVIKKEGRL